MKNTKEILLHAIYKDYANTKFNKSIYLNIPKNNDLVELLDDCVNLFNVPKDTILFIAINKTGYRSVINAGYRSIYYYDMVSFDYENNYYKCNTKIDPYIRYIVIQSCDNMNMNSIKSLENISAQHTKHIMCYDSMLPKRELGKDIAENMYKYTGYTVQKIGRDKPNTNTTMYNIRNKMRAKNFDLQKFLESYEGVPPYYNIKNISIDEILDVLNINIPIITNSKTRVGSMNAIIRTKIGFDMNYLEDSVPKVNEIMCVHHPSLAIVKDSNININLPVGYRFKIKSIFPIFNDGVYQITFDHTDILDRTYECIINISAGYIDYLYNGYLTEEMTKSITTTNANLCYFGYVMSNWMTLDYTYDNIVVWLDTSYGVNKNDVYMSLIPAQQYLSLIIENKNN